MPAFPCGRIDLMAVQCTRLHLLACKQALFGNGGTFSSPHPSPQGTFSLTGYKIFMSPVLRPHSTSRHVLKSKVADTFLIQLYLNTLEVGSICNWNRILRTSRGWTTSRVITPDTDPQKPHCREDKPLPSSLRLGSKPTISSRKTFFDAIHFPRIIIKAVNHKSG